MPPSCDCIAYSAQLEDLTMVDSDSNGRTKTPLIVESYHLLSSTAAPCQSHKTRPNRPCSRGPSCAKYGPVFRLTLFLGWGSRESGVGGLWMLLNTSILQAIQVVNRTCTGGEGVVGSPLTWPSLDRICAVEDCLSGTLGRWCRALIAGWRTASGARKRAACES